MKRRKGRTTRGENDEEQEDGPDADEGQQQLSRAGRRLCSFHFLFLKISFHVPRYNPKGGLISLGNIYISYLNLEVPLAAKTIR
jgi:hypothetical protein